MYLRAIGRGFTQMIAYFLVMNSKRCNYLRTVPPIHPLYSRQIDHPVPAPCGVWLRVSCIFPLLPCSLVYRPFHISPQQEQHIGFVSIVD